MIIRNKRRRKSKYKSTINKGYESGVPIVITGDKEKRQLEHVKTPWYSKTQKASRGELKIEKYLKEHKINFNKEKEFKDLKNPKTGQRLRFDFWIPKLNLAIEFDGKQHKEYSPELHGTGKVGLTKFYNQVLRDCVKDLYCRQKNIRLLRIRYDQYLEIEEILEKELQ